jgi:LacI family transcriptional regulator, galactose operon repressor
VVGGGKGTRQSVTLRDVAAAAAVHVATASRALDPDSAHPVSPQTRALVEQVAKRLGYRGHMMARGLRRGRSSTVGVVAADLANPYTAPVLRGLAYALEPAGFMALVTESRDESAMLDRAVNHLLARQVDALVLISVRSGDRTRVLNWAQKVPVVLAVRKLPRSGVPAVTHDDRGGARLAAEHLAGLGHRRVVQLPGPLDVQPFKDRFESFAANGHEVGLEVRSTGPAAVSSFEEGHRMMREVITGGLGGASAVFAHNDGMAMGAVLALREAGLSCPRDISVVGYNDVAMADALDPPLTTVRLDGHEIGRQAGTIALAAIGGVGTLPRFAPTPAELIVRQSTAPSSRRAPVRPGRPA